MNLAELQPNDRVFVDANSFIYHFGGYSADCRAFLERCARREVLGYTSTLILSEVIRRMMVAKAIQQV